MEPPLPMMDRYFVPKAVHLARNFPKSLICFILRPMKVQIFSDVHLEFGEYAPSETDADVIVAAGDIDQQAEGVAWLNSLGKPVIYIAGNHEVWGGDLLDSIRLLREACAGTNVHFLENNQITLGDVTFYGCTLWSDFCNQDPEIQAHARQYMNDFSFIGYEGRHALPSDLADYSIQSLQWLKKALGRPTDKKQVVVTHHTPSLRSWGFDVDDPLRFAYCNQLDDMIRAQNIALWVHGHVHCGSDYYIKDTRIVCNPRGYYKHNLVEEFEPAKVVEI